MAALTMKNKVTHGTVKHLDGDNVGSFGKISNDRLKGCMHICTKLEIFVNNGYEHDGVICCCFCRAGVGGAIRVAHCACACAASLAG